MAVPAAGPTIDPAYLGRLMARMRGVQGREMAVDEDSGSNPTDDDEIDALQDTPGDLSRDKAATLINEAKEDPSRAPRPVASRPACHWPAYPSAGSPRGTRPGLRSW